MYRGHDPREIEGYPWRAIDAYLAIEPLLDARGSVGGIPDDSG
jgi:hypothetical protein